MSQKILVISGFLLIIIFGGVILANEIQAQTSSITVVSPNGGETWVPGSLFTISWVSVDASNSVGLTLLQNGNHVLGIGTLPNTGKYAWTIPNNLSGSGYSVKVVDMGNNSIYDESNGTFSIGNYTPTIVIASGPSPNQKIIKGSQLNVIWSSQSVGPVKVKIVDEFGTAIYSYSVDVSNSMGDNAIGMVMNYPSGGYYIKVESTSNPAVYAKSSKFFIYESNDITPPSAPTNITVAKNSPSDPSYKLQFSYILPSDIDYYCINIYRNTELLGGILSDKVVSCANKGSVPGGDTGYFPYEDLYIKGKASGTVSFTVKAVDIAGNESINTDKYSYTWSNLPAPNLISPVIGSTVTSNYPSLRWTSVANAKSYQYQILASGGGIVKSQSIDFQSGSTMIVGSNLVNGNYEWKVRACDNLLSVSMPNDSNCGNWSNVWSFKVLASTTQPSITVLSPNGGETLQTGQSYTIKWTSSHPQITYIDLLKFSDVSPYMQIMGGIPYSAGEDTFSWNVQPSTAAGKYYIRVMNSEKTVIDTSDASFSIIAPTVQPSITVLSPNGGEKWTKGMSKNITWFRWQGEPADLKNEIRLIKAENWPTSNSLTAYNYYLIKDSNNITNGDVNRFTWIVGDIDCPDCASWKQIIPEGDYIVRVIRYKGAEVTYFDDSDAPFSIIAPTTQPSITVLSPNGGEEWQVGKTYSIVWKSNELEQVNINLLSADPVNENSYRVARLFSNISASSGNHSWIVPENIKCLSLPCITLPKHRNHKIEVVDARYGRDSAVSKKYSDISDAPFSIVSPSVILEHPTDTNCLPDNTLIKLPNDPKIYIIIDCQKKWIRTVEEFQREGYDWSDVQETNSPVIEAYAEYLETTVNLLRAIGQQKVYRIVNDRRLWVPTISAFNAQGLKWEDIQDKNESEINQYPLIKLLRASGDSKVYYITDSGLKRHIPTAVVFNSYDNKWEDVVEVTNTELNAYGSNDLIKKQDDHKIYKLDKGQKRWIRTIEAFNRFGYDWSKVAPVNDIEFNAYTLGEEIK